MGFYITLKDQPTIYLSSDTIYTEAVYRVIKTYLPDIRVLACGTAQFDLFDKLIMNEEDIIQFVRDSSGKVIANHM